MGCMPGEPGEPGERADWVRFGDGERDAEREVLLLVMLAVRAIPSGNAHRAQLSDDACVQARPCEKNNFQLLSFETDVLSFFV